ncbi:MAG: MaoC family dehydratase [Desulfobacteraceae bacterium]|nr:MaoC family dehydratase [Desulfobacteraceae bacterium]
MKKDLKVGDSVSISKVFSDLEVRQFAEISGDTNPIHLDEAYACESFFGQRIVHGMLLASLFSGLMGVKLPGEGAIYLGQTLNFKAPVMIGERVTASVEIINIRQDKPIVKVRTLCINDQGQVVIDGEAVLKV